MRLLLLKLGALNSFLGGPLYCVDAWTPRFGSAFAFALAFAPLALLLYGELSLNDERDRWNTWAIVGGLVGTAALVVMNLIVAYLLLGAPDHPLRGLHTFGIVLGMFVSALYVRSARRWLRDEHDAPRPEPSWSTGPDLDDWGLLVIGVLFVVAGLVILPSNVEIGLVTLVFFGLCTALFVHTILRKRRWARGVFTPASLVGGRRYPLRRKPLLLLGAALVVLGGVGVTFGTSYPWLFRILVAGVGVLGLVVLLLVALGRPRGYVQFDPDALEIGHAHHRVRFPWDAVYVAIPGDLYGHPIVHIVLTEPEAVEVVPEERRHAVIAGLRRNERRLGSHEGLMPQRYGLDAPLVHTWIRDLVCDPSARERLG